VNENARREGLGGGRRRPGRAAGRLWWSGRRLRARLSGRWCRVADRCRVQARAESTRISASICVRSAVSRSMVARSSSVALARRERFRDKNAKRARRKPLTSLRPRAIPNFASLMQCGRKKRTGPWF
jgi:hypothetical protein